MRKFNLLLISLILCIGVAYAQTAITPVGEGTQASPYQIISLENLYWISEQSNLAEKAGVNIEIFNIKGQKVKSLINEEISAGRHSVVWNGQDENHKKVSSGVYFYKMQAGKYIKINKMIMMK
ncbi:MAG: FlgD immunoglobulin-like domain containing protein [Candidatus Cloacimonetes bacterium]|nr:FlgD immunoglobulin-like domain containing protein [Candidatus Cloacimonadota bacterium]